MVPKRIKDLFIRYEISPKQYFSRLRNPDKEALEELLPLLYELPVGILAVGSTTFPKKHWQRRRLLNEYQPQLRAREEYHDLDLLITPQEARAREELILLVQEQLGKQKISYVRRDHSLAGIRYEKEGEGFRGYIHTDYYQPSIQAMIRQTSIDLLFSREEQAETSKQVLAYHRANNLACSHLR